MTILVLVLSLFMFFLLGVPVAYALGLSSVLALLTMGNTSLIVVAQSMFGGMNAFTLLALPFFILAGNIMAAGGVSKRLINFAQSLVGHIPGGLAIVSVVACAFFAAVSGSAAATCAAVGAIMVPCMREANYDDDFSAAVIGTAATSGIIIPPSVPMIVYCISVGGGISVGDCFMAGIIQGIIYCAALAVLAIIRSKKHHYHGTVKATGKERWEAFKGAILPLMMPVIILGGIYGGFFTATEASVVAAVYGLVASTLILREISWKETFQIIKDSAKTAGGLLLLLGAANVFGVILTRERIPQLVTGLFLELIDSKFAFLLIMNVLFLILGMFMEAGPIIIILAPLLAPVAQAYGVDLVHFGVIMIMNLAIGMASPPFGLSLFVITDISGCKFLNICKQMLPCFAVMIAVLLFITYCEPLVLLPLGG